MVLESKNTEFSSNGGFMADTANSNRRRTPRQALIYYLKVIDIDTGKEIGRIADITSAGMMLVGNRALNKKKTRRVRVIVEKSIFDISPGNLDVSVQIRWSKPDANPALTLTGMLFLDLNDTGRRVVRTLIQAIGMSGQLDLNEENIDSIFLGEEKL